MDPLYGSGPERSPLKPISLAELDRPATPLLDGSPAAPPAPAPYGGDDAPPRPPLPNMLNHGECWSGVGRLAERVCCSTYFSVLDSAVFCTCHDTYGNVFTAFCGISTKFALDTCCQPLHYYALDS